MEYRSNGYLPTEQRMDLQRNVPRTKSGHCIISIHPAAYEASYFVRPIYLVKSQNSCFFLSRMTSYLAAQTRTHAHGTRCVFLFRCDPWPMLQVHAAGSQIGGVCPPSYLSTPCDTTFSPCRVPEWVPVNSGSLHIKQRCACHSISNKHEQRQARLCDKWRTTIPLPTSSCNLCGQEINHDYAAVLKAKKVNCFVAYT